jgi:hypothetical protein
LNVAALNAASARRAVIAAVDLLERNPHPTDAEIRHVPGIFAAVPAT